MKVNKLIWLLFFFHFPNVVLPQEIESNYIAGFTTLSLVDSSRIYKTNTSPKDDLHFRPVDLDIWYPSRQKSEKRLKFGELIKPYEDRSGKYHGEKDFTGVTNEIALYFLAELGVDGDASLLLDLMTDSYYNSEQLSKTCPLIIYLAGFNGMGFENNKVLERLAQQGYVVVAIGSNGRYPGVMHCKLPDMMEQVYDAEFALNYLKRERLFSINFEKIGVLGYSLGGLAGSVLVNRNPFISALVSFDGSEMNYFGQQGGYELDLLISETCDNELLQPENQTINYLYLEGGKKPYNFFPTGHYSYFEKLNSRKHYLRFLNGTHEDFSSLSSVLYASSESAETYKSISDLTVHFFDTYLNDRTGFIPNYRELMTREKITNQPIDVKPAKHLGDIKGLISDVKTKKPLPYVNIGVLNKEVGTVTNTNGEFELMVNDDMLSDSIRISMIGYEPILMVVNQLFHSKEYHLIEMQEKLDELDEVVITGKEYKNKKLGNKTTSRFLSTAFSYDQLGAEMGMRINVKKAPTFVETFNFNIAYNQFSARSIFRLNIYTVENNKPGVNILRNNILIPIQPKETGMKSIDLSGKNIVLKDDIFVTLEWVDTEGTNKKGEGIYFSLALFSKGTIERVSSQARYKKLTGLGVGFNFDVKQ